MYAALCSHTQVTLSMITTNTFDFNWICLFVFLPEIKSNSISTHLTHPAPGWRCFNLSQNSICIICTHATVRQWCVQSPKDPLTLAPLYRFLQICYRKSVPGLWSWTTPWAHFSISGALMCPSTPASKYASHLTRARNSSLVYMKSVQPLLNHEMLQSVAMTSKGEWCQKVT